MCVEILAWNAAVPSSEGIEQPLQPQERDPAELIRDDRALGLLVVAEPFGRRGQDLRLAAAAGEDQEHVPELLLVGPVGRDQRRPGPFVATLRGRRLLAT